MAYNVYFSCDTCGAAYNWVNHTVSQSTAARIARSSGWSVGKTWMVLPGVSEEEEEERKCLKNTSAAQRR